MDTAIVILNYNGKNYLERFLPSVIMHSKNVRVIVADNASTDDSVDFMRQNYPEIELVLNKKNGGFAAGYNEALSQVKAKYYVLLNSDIEVTEGWMTGCLELLERDQQIAACQPKIRSFNDKDKFEHAGAAGGFLDRDYFPFCRGRIFELPEEDSGQYDDEKEVFWATGACLFIRSKLFHDLGGLDEAFFAHMEEIDLCWRIKKTGYKIYYTANGTVYHVGGGTLSYQSPRKTYLNFRNSLFMIVKNHDGILFFKMFKRLWLDGIASGKFLISGNIKSFWAVMESHVAFYLALPKLLRQRKSVKKNSTTFNKTGLYRKSIVFQRFFLGKTKFSALNETDFMQ